MVSLWGSKKDDQGRAENGDHAQQDNDRHSPARDYGRRSQEPEPDERTRLLPREGNGYLSPDDPAVSIDPSDIYLPFMCAIAEKLFESDLGVSI